MDTVIPVIIGEYGTLSNSSAFFADLESKQIPSLAWVRTVQRLHAGPSDDHAERVGPRPVRVGIDREELPDVALNGETRSKWIADEPAACARSACKTGIPRAARRLLM